MDKFLKLILSALIIAATASCEKSQKPQASDVEDASAKKAVAKAVEETPPPAPKVVEPPKPVQDKRILSLELKKDNLKAGGILEAYLDLNVPFENPFSIRDISVEASISGESNGVTITAPLYFEGGNSDKSVWRLKRAIPKEGEYKIMFGVRGKGKNFFSLEYPFSVGGGEPSKLFKVSKKNFSGFSNKAGQSMRAIGANFPIQLDIESQKKLLERLAQAGGNTIRLTLEAPCTAFVPEDSDTAKAGWINTTLFSKVEEIMDAANALGIKTIICFSSPLSFSENAYATSYFAKSNKAPTPKKFFSSNEVQQMYNSMLQYAALRLGSREDLLMWQVFDGIDAFDIADLDGRLMWLSNMTVMMRDADVENGHPLMLSAATSSEMEFVWSGEACDVLAFDILDVRDFANSVNAHSKFFSKKYKKGVGISKFGYSANAVYPPDPSYIYIHNTMWAAELTPSPLLPLVSLSSATAEAELKSIKSISAFEKKFNLANADLELVQLKDAIVLPAAKAINNSFVVQPAFGKTYVARESSNDLAELVLDSDGTIIKNTLPVQIQKDAIVNIRINGVPNNKCTLSFDIVSIPAADKFDLHIMRNDEPLLTEKISADGIKQFVGKDENKRAFLTKTVKMTLEQGNQNIMLQLLSGGSASMEIANIKVDGLGSNMGVGSVRLFGAKDKLTGRNFIWFKRAATDSFSYGKFKLFNREVPELRSFEYSMQLNPSTSYRVTWWNTRAGEEIAVGVLKTTQDGTLKLRTPPFRTDAVCIIEEMK